MIDPKPSKKVRKAQQIYGLSPARARAALENEKTIDRSTGKLKKQQKKASARAQFGPRGKAAPVIIRSLETGEILPVAPPKKQQRARDRAAAATVAPPEVVTPDSAGDPYADPYADLTDKATWDVRPL